ncbi:formin-like protein 12 isoform X2 [Centruroides sculpturatus]|uniref:formin-like protein 12 isoform X2 n=1 Tax=Centruroides sculpturatus TaxID=218467 RepID=UPI000C6E02ED|nr:formin-like protein 12 isoform X2 [Centruroides sculpturatus]
MCAQPIINPALPFVGAIPGGLQPGRMIRVQGVAHPNARCFSINLQCGPGSSSQDDIALHLSPVFSPPPRLVRNSLQNQQWGPEESHGPYFPFVVGQNFEILILTEGDEYKIAVNGQHFCEFKHRIPIYRVTSLSINGEATINQINYEGTVSPMQQPSAGGFSGGFISPPGMPTSTSPLPPQAYSGSNPIPPPPTSYGQQPYPTQPGGVHYQTNPYGAPPLPPGSNPYGTPPVPPGSSPYGPSPYGVPPGGYSSGYPHGSKQSGGLGSLLPSGLAAGLGALAGSALLGKGKQDSDKKESSTLTTEALKTGIGLLAEAAAVSAAEPKEREKMGDNQRHNGKGKDSSAADAALAVGVEILTNAAVSSMIESKPKDKNEQLSDFAAGIGKLTEAAVVSATEQKHGGYPGYPYGKPKSSSPIPIGLAAGAGALAGAAMLGKSPVSNF